MEKTTIANVTSGRDVDYESAIDRYLMEMERMQTDMDERQKRIEQTRAETELIRVDIKKMLAEMKVQPA
jgi:hypothetical protein